MCFGNGSKLLLINYLLDVLQRNDIQAGNVLLWLSGSAVVGFVVAGWLGDRFGLARMVLIAAKPE